MVSQPKPPKAEHSRFSPMTDNCYRRGPLRVLTILVSMSYSCLRHERLQSHPTKVGRYIVLYLLSTSPPFIVRLSSVCRPGVDKLSSVLVIIVLLSPIYRQLSVGLSPIPTFIAGHCIPWADSKFLCHSLQHFPITCLITTHSFNNFKSF